MRYSSDRVMLFDKDGERIGDLNAGNLLSLPRMVGEVNGEHTLTIRTTDTIAPGTRALWRDDTGQFHEWVYDQPKEQHHENEYVFVWSLEADLEAACGREHWAASVSGTHDPISAQSALEIALSDQDRWEVGNVTVTTMAGASFYDGQVWDYVKQVVEKWGGELSATITVGPFGVIKREVNLLAHVGSEIATRRFDYGEDATDIVRIAASAPYYCRVRPRGGSAKTDNDGVDYSDRVGIEELTLHGEDYIEDEESALVFRTKNPDGSWSYPTKTVCYQLDTEGDDEELYNKSLADLQEHTRPKVTYEANVLQFARAGLDYRGVAEGDNIQIVDMCFSSDGTPLRIEGRVLRIEQDVPIHGTDSGNTDVTIGNLSTSIRDAIREVSDSSTSSIARQVNEVVAGGAIVYLQTLLDTINAELNITGGYYYLVPGKGIFTYDTRVSDPLVGTEASQVTQVVGGGIRIANGRTQAGDWDWRSVFTSGHVAADVVTAANLVAGYIGNPDGSVYIDLDNGVLRIGPTAIMGDGTTTMQGMMQSISDARRSATDFLSYESGVMTLGRIDSAIKLLLTNSRLHFDTSSGEVASFGMNSSTGIWEMNVDTANVENYLRFNNFTWIARENGNMSIKRFA